jgi:putative ABC transport system permease protein
MRFRHRLIALLRRDRAEHDLAREVASHLALLEDDYRRRGMSDDEARRQARLALGGIEQTKERHRDERSFPWLEDLRRDVPYAIRGLRRNPGFAFAAVLTLALGIGITTAMFGVVNAVLLRPLPYPGADRLVRVRPIGPPSAPGRPSAPPNITYSEFVEWRDRSTSLSPIAALLWDPQVMIPTPAGTARLSGGLVSPEWFELLGVHAMLGRRLLPSDVVDRPDVVVLSARTWRRYFSSDPSVIGTTITVHSRISRLMSGQAVEIVGVMPDGFQDPVADFEFWLPLIVPAPATPGARTPGVQVIGRLDPDASIEAASEEATAILASIRNQPGASADEPAQATVEFIKDRMVSPVRPALNVLMAAVAIVLLIVCANVASLLLARATSRRREIGIRLAIGGSRSRIVRQLLSESLVLALAGGALGALIGAATLATLRALVTVEAQGVFRLVFGGNLLPRASELVVDVPILIFAAGLAIATTILFGLAPAVHAARTDVRQATALRTGRGAGEGRLRTFLVVGQLAMATVLLVGAGLLIHSFVRLSQVEMGYSPTGMLAFQLVLPEDAPTVRKADVIEDILGRTRKMPGVEAAGFAYAGPLIGLTDRLGHFVPPGRSLEEMKQSGDQPQLRSISADYLRAMHVPLLAGRLFNESDNSAAPLVVVVNRALAQRYFDGSNPVGSTLAWHSGDPGAPAGATILQVIGVVDDVRYGRLDQAASPEVMFDYRQMLAIHERWGSPKRLQEVFAFGFMSFAVRTSGDPAALVPAVREAVAAADPRAGLDAIAPMAELVSTSIARPRFYAVLLGLFAAMAAILAAVGVYGVLAYAVVQRTQEIGVRMALGADRRDVMRLVLRRGIALAAIGISLGLAGAAGLSRYLQGLLFGLTPLDGLTYALVTSGFVALALLASWLPARRATRVDPMVALRAE